MPKLTGPFDVFRSLDTLNTQLLFKWLSLQLQPQVVENHFANRMLYPQTIPVSAEEMAIDFAILREAIRQEPTDFYHNLHQTLTIPEGFLERFPPPSELIKAFIDGLSLHQHSELIIKRLDGGTLKGYIFFPDKLPYPAPHQINFHSYNGTSLNTKIITSDHPQQQFTAASDDLVFLPQAANQQIELKIDDQPPVLLNIGNLGLFIDFRPIAQP